MTKLIIFDLDGVNVKQDLLKVINEMPNNKFRKLY